MKTTFLYLLLASLSLACTYADNNFDHVPTPNPDPVPNVTFFRQENVGLRASQLNCLLTKSQAGKFGGDTIVLNIINNQATYEQLFDCNSTNNLTPIDFQTKTLLIGVSGKFSAATPHNISRIAQNLIQSTDSTYTYQVEITGKPGGGEFFGFCGLASKIDPSVKVKLKMTYKFE